MIPGRHLMQLCHKDYNQCRILFSWRPRRRLRQFEEQEEILSGCADVLLRTSSGRVRANQNHIPKSASLAQCETAVH